MEEDINFMLNFDVDVFEEKFDRWNQLPPEMKIKILQFLPFKTLKSFMLLSRECFWLGSCVRIKIHSIELKEPSYDEFHSEFNDIRVDLTVNNKYVLFFTKNGRNTCSVTRQNKRKGHVQSEEVIGFHKGSPQSAAMRTFFQVTKNAEIRKLSVWMRYNSREVQRTIERLPLGTALKCKSFCICTHDVNLLFYLLSFVTPGCGLWIELSSFGKPYNIHISSIIFNMSLMKSASFLNIDDAVADLNNEQIVRLQAHRIYLQAPRISSKGINGLLHQWFDGVRRIDWVMLIDCQNLVDDVDAVLEGVDPSCVIHDGDFLRKNIIDKYILGEMVGGYLTAVRNKFGSLLLISLGTNFCNLRNPYLPNITPWC